jgi:hypothetical protein
MLKNLILNCFLLLFSSNIYANSYADYRYSYEEMLDIASSKKLSHRIFYKPSIGPNAKWFDDVKKGNLEAVKKAVESGQDIEVKDDASLGQTALLWAAFIGYEDMVEYLIKAGANLYATDRADVPHVFKSAVLGKNVNVVKYLYPMFKGKIDLNEQEDDGETLVIVASSNNRIEIVKYLISLGVDLNIVSVPKNQNALTFACSKGYTEMAQLLINNGAINFKTKQPSC